MCSRIERLIPNASQHIQSIVGRIKTWKSILSKSFLEGRWKILMPHLNIVACSLESMKKEISNQVSNLRNIHDEWKRKKKLVKRDRKGFENIPFIRNGLSEKIVFENATRHC